MKKKSMQALLAMALLAILLFSWSTIQQSIIGGNIPFSIGSITAYNQKGMPITLVSNDAELQTVTFRANVVVGSVGNEAFSAQNLGNVLQDDVSYNNRAEFDVTKITDYYDYPVINDYEQVYDYTYSETSWFQPCPSDPNVFSIGGPFQFTRYCIRRVPVALKGHFGSPNYYNMTKVRMVVYDAKGSQLLNQQIEVDNTTRRSAEFRGADNTFYGLVQHRATYNTNLTAPDQGQVAVLQNYFWNPANEWHVVPWVGDDGLERYLSAQQFLESKLLQLQTQGFTTDFTLNFLGFGIPVSCAYTDCAGYLQTVVNGMRNKVAKLTDESDVIPYPQASTRQEWAGGGTWRAEVPANVWQYANLLFSVSAEAVGAIISVAMPANLSISPSRLEVNFADPSPQQLTVGVTSEGGSGCFKAAIDSCGAFVVSSTTTACLSDGQRGSIYLTVLPKVQSETNWGTCVVRVYDDGKPSNFATVSFEGKLNKAMECEPGEYDVRAKSIFKCTEEGVWKFVKTCQYAVIYVGGVPDCSVPVLCGNGVVDAGEQCDGADLAGQTCESIGYDGGVLACSSGCAFDVKDCKSNVKCLEGEIYRRDASGGWCEPCENKESDSIWVSGYKIVYKSAPLYLIPLPWGGGLLQTGFATEVLCTEVFNWGLVFGVVVLAVAFVVFFVFGKGRLGKKKQKKKGRRRK